MSETCETCRFSIAIKLRRKLCCFRYPPTIHRTFFGLTEFYPAVFPNVKCGEHQPRKETQQ